MQNSLLIVLFVLVAIFVVPLICRKIHVPSIVGFILTGVVLGPSVFGILENTPAIALMGKLGLLYIMFQVGIEIDMNNFHEQRYRSALFGFLSFAFPFVLGSLATLLFGWSWTASLLFGAMLGSHTLMTYPIVSRYGIQKTPAVTIVVGGTMVAITFSLLALAFLTADKTSVSWYITLSKVIIMLGLILWIFPLVCQWVFKRWQDPATSFMLVMVLMVASALLAEWAGLDSILGAFICGAALNGRVPNHSPLMKRINFVGNSLFVPIFLLSVGLMINIEVFWQSWLVWAIAATMIFCKLLGKWLSAWVSQRLFHMAALERQIMFSLTHATAAGTLAIVTIGYQAELFNAETLNGAIIMILVLCTISSFLTERAAKLMALQEEAKLESERTQDDWTFISVNDQPNNQLPTTNDHLNRLAELSQLNNVELVECSDWQDAHQFIERSGKSIIVYKEYQPLNTINRLLVAVPKYAEKERDFISCFGQIRRLSSQIGAKVTFYATPETQTALKALCHRQGKFLRASYREIEDWEDSLRLAKDIEPNDLAVFISSRSSTASYHPLFEQIPDILSRFYKRNSYILLYPEQDTEQEGQDTFLMDIPQADSTWRIVVYIKDALHQLIHKIQFRK